MTTSRPRWYDDACGTAHALDLVGERWALLIMREMFFGPKRFSDLRADLPGLSATVLTQRLESLEASGIVVRRRLPPPAATQVYDLTDWGRESEPIFASLGRWAARSPAHDPTLPLSATSMMLSLRTMLDHGKAAGLSMRIGFRFGETRFLAHLHDGMLDVAHGDLADADAVIAAAPTTVAGTVYGGLAFEPLEAAGLLAIEGDRALAARFVRLFTLPPKAAKP